MIKDTKSIQAKISELKASGMNRTYGMDDSDAKLVAIAQINALKWAIGEGSSIDDEAPETTVISLIFRCGSCALSFIILLAELKINIVDYNAGPELIIYNVPCPKCGHTEKQIFVDYKH